MTYPETDLSGKERKENAQNTAMDYSLPYVIKYAHRSSIFTAMVI